MSSERKPTIGVIGSTGAVGTQLLTLLEQKKFPTDLLSLFASTRSAGSTTEYCNTEKTVLPVEQNTIRGIQLAFLAAGATVSKSLVPALLEQGTMVIDNSSAFRMDPDVPLIVPNVSPTIYSGQRMLPVGNCSAIILASAIAPLHNAFGVHRIVVSTYQSISGAGQFALKELMEQTRQVCDGQEPNPTVFPHPCAFNVFSHDSEIGEDGFNVEERKVVEETKKMLDTDFQISITCIRVPVRRAHTMSIVAECQKELPDLSEIRDLYEGTKGIVVVDDRESNTFPMPSISSDTDDVYVGRFRRDPAFPNALSFMASADQLRRGAATTAIELAEMAGFL